MMHKTSQLEPSRAISGQGAYHVPRAAAPVDLRLDGNEGAQPPAVLFTVLSSIGASVIRNYPSACELENLLAERHGVDPSQVLVTAGADDALDRMCRAMLEEGRSMILPEPSFEMLRRYGLLAGGAVVSVPWPDGAFPRAAVLEAVDDSTAMIVMVTPNNPTGGVATAADLAAVASGAPHALIVLDHAYVEFADEDLTEAAKTYPNVVVARTLSKAWGLAGLRVGYAIGPARVIEWLRATGHPYAVSGPSLAMAKWRVETGAEDMAAFVDAVADERRRLEVLLNELGADAQPSQGNFVFARHPNSLWIRDGLASLGIAIRAFPGREGLEDGLRIACPGNEDDFARLEHGLRTVLAPEAILFDVDGVLADVSESYRRCIIETAASFGVEIGLEDVTAVKAAGQANNDWVVTRRILASRGVEVSLDEVTSRFEELYQGTDDAPGLRSREGLICTIGWLEKLAGTRSLGLVTGRPRKDAERFLRDEGIEGFFDALVCMEDGPLKPDPAPVLRAMELMDVERVWFIGDTPDDARAGRAAGAVSLGIIAPGEAEGSIGKSLIETGAGRILAHLDELEELLK
ncbi:MAG: aminotransferase class I/II-fold pyridoxal phosphate-dependent enzyme [Bradymonadaceae bacterium]